jgi:hypothetical protein
MTGINMFFPYLAICWLHVPFEIPSIIASNLLGALPLAEVPTCF